MCIKTELFLNLQILVSRSCSICTVVHVLQFPENILPPYISICLSAVSGDQIRGMLAQTDKQILRANKNNGSEKGHKSDALQLGRTNFFL